MKCSGTSGPRASTNHARHAFQLFLGVVLAGNEQVGHFQPDVALAREPPQGVLDRGEVRARQFPIKVLREAFEIDVRRVHHLKQRLACQGRDITGGDRHGLHARGTAGLGAIDRILGPDHRVVVGEGHALATQLPGRTGHGFRIGPLAQGIDFPRLGDFPVLAELAPQVAARRAEGKHRTSRIEMIQRLLFDRIDAEARTAAVGRRDHLPVEILADEAESPLALGQRAAPRAKIANDLAAVVRFVPPTGGLDAIGRNGTFRRKNGDLRHIERRGVGA